MTAKSSGPLDAGFRQRWLSACCHDGELAVLAVAANVGFVVRADAWTLSCTFRDGAFIGGAPARDAAVEFEVVATEESWDEFFSWPPRPPFQSIFGMLMRVGGTEVRGSMLRFAQHAHLVRRVLELGRQERTGRSSTRVPHAVSSRPGPDEPHGHYRTVDVRGRPNRMFYEVSGSGRDMLLLHTAGADARQYHHMLADERLTTRFRMVAPDLPWHGRSLPPPGTPPGGFSLSTDVYVDTIVTFVEELELGRPIVVGCSMAGLICLELAYRRPDLFGGVVACEASDVVPGRQVGWALHPLVNQALFVPEWVDGLMAPQTAPEHRQEIWWTYSQGGFGTFSGDIAFYSGDFDARDRVGRIDTELCPVVMLTGEYDYSCTPDMSRRTAERIPGAVFRELPAMGHFPHAENPGRFAEHLLDAVAVIDEKGAAR